MKKFLKISFLFFMGFLMLNACDDENEDDSIGREIEYINLPVAIQEWIERYFAEEETTSVYEYTVNGPMKYYVTFENGIRVDFDRDNDWVKIQADNGNSLNEIHLSFLPQNIRSYLIENNFHLRVSYIEKKNYGFNVKIVDHVSLSFNKDGNYLGENIDYKNDLPTSIQEFINIHFSLNYGTVVKNGEAENSINYWVYLENGFELFFNSDGEWKVIDGINQIIPESVYDLLPEYVRESISANYSGSNVIRMENTSMQYLIDLIDGQGKRITIILDKELP